MPGSGNPLDDLKAMRERMARLLSETQRSVADLHESMDASAWRPDADVFEADGEVVILVDVAGVDRTSLSLEVDGNRMSLRGERRPPAGLDPARVVRQERRYGRFVRIFDVPLNVDVARIAAEQRNGVLSIRLPRPEASSGRPIQIVVE